MIAKDLNDMTVKVSIDGKPCDVAHLELRQRMFGHHTFTLEINYRAKGNGFWTVPVREMTAPLGKAVSIRIREREGATIDFEGVVCSMHLGGRDGNQGVVTLYGGSPTLLMTDDYSMDSFTDTDLGSIVHETVTKLGYDIGLKIEPRSNCNIPYVCRYKESSYGFLNRLFASCGESFYYDGKKLVAGFSPEKNQQEKVRLSYRYDLLKMDISASLGNYNIERYDYDPRQDRTVQWASYPDSRNPDKFTKNALARSQEIYKDYTVLPGAMPVTPRTVSLMEHSTYAEHFGKLAEGSRLRATTKTCKVALGSIVSLDIDPGMQEYLRELGDFRIIEVVHRYDDTRDGTYENDIVGINAYVDYIPAGDVVKPVAMPEVATVVDNKDPRNMGRVKVKFVWQQLEDHPQNKTSGWMRVQTPDAGSSDMVDKNRGFFFVPEIGDQVMVSYELGDPDRPFVSGSLYHINNTQGIAGQNNIKSIQTRSGIKLILNDAEKSVHIEDPSGNTWDMDGNGNITVNAPETIIFNAKNINLEATENIYTTAGKDMKIDVGQNLDQTIKGICLVSIEKTGSVAVTEGLSVKTEDTLLVEAGQDFTVNAGGNISIEAPNGEMQLASKGELFLKSDKNVTNAK